MKTIASLFLITTLLFACKNSGNPETEISRNESETKNEEMKSSPYKYSLAQWSVHTPIYEGLMDPMDFAAYAKQLGFDGVEYVDQLYPVDTEVTYLTWAMNLAEAWKERSDSLGIDNVLIMVDTAGELADPVMEKRNESIEKHKAWVNAADYIGAASIRVNMFGLTEPRAWHEAAVASLTSLCRYAATKNINVLVENHAQLSNDAAKLAAVISEVNMSNCGTLPDFGNFCVRREGGDRWGPAPCVEEYDPYKGISELMPYAGGVSAKSNNFDENGDETEIDYYRMMQIVKDHNFSGYIGIEYEDDTLLDPKAGILATKALLLKADAQTN